MAFNPNQCLTCICVSPIDSERDLPSKPKQEWFARRNYAVNVIQGKRTIRFNFIHYSGLTCKHTSAIHTHTLLTVRYSIHTLSCIHIYAHARTRQGREFYGNKRVRGAEKGEPPRSRHTYTHAHTHTHARTHSYFWHRSGRLNSTWQRRRVPFGLGWRGGGGWGRVEGR